MDTSVNSGQDMTTPKPTPGRIMTAILVSIVMDVLLSGGELFFIPGTAGGVVVIEEAIEMLISGLLMKNIYPVTWADRIIGFLPIPGVTAVTVRLFRALVTGK